MKTKPIRWQLSLSYAAITLITALLLGIILLGILMFFYIEQEIGYLMMNAEAIGAMVAQIEKAETHPNELQQYLEGLAFISNTQIRLLNSNGEILVDTGPPQERITLSYEAFPENNTSFYVSGSSAPELFVEGIPTPALDESVTYMEAGDPGFYPGFVLGSSVFEVGMDTLIYESNIPRSNQVVQLPYYDHENDHALLGYVELSNGPAYGREILYSVTWGWAIAGTAAVLLAAVAGIWVSRKFSTPLESLTRTTSQMAAGNLSARAGIERQDEFGLLANSFNHMADNIETKVTTLRRFVADAAHELHTPLTALRINLELIDDKHAPRALEKVERMDALTRSLLDLSQLEANDSEIQQDDVELTALLRDLAEPYASRAEQAKLNFNLEIECDPVSIIGDAAQLGILIHNLLDNAIKFTPTGGQVDVQLSEQDDAVQLTVADTGIGIPKDDLPHLFSRFHRGRNASAYPGSGLGLAIVKTIADQHGARIRVESNTNRTVLVVEFTPYQS